MDKGLFWQIGANLDIPKEPSGYDETLEKFSGELDKYFSEDIDLFPALSREDIIPNLFDVVHRVEIGEKFPSDEAARDLCELIRYVLINNFASLTVYKFVIAVVAVVVPLLVGLSVQLTYPSLGRGEIIGLLAACYAAALLIFAGTNTIFFAVFRQRSEKSCSAIELGLQSVFSGIDLAYRDAIEKVQSDENRGADVKSQWPHRANWWSRLIVWYPKRIEYLEKVFQIASWRILFSFTFWKYGGLAVSILAMTALSFAVIMLGAVTGVFSILLFLAYVTLIAIMSVFLWSPRADFINANISTIHWNRFSSFSSNKRIAELIEHFINNIIGEQRIR